MLPKGFLAAGQIFPSRFVKLATTGLDSQVLQAGDGNATLGISQEWMHDAPIPSETTGDAAASGEAIRVYGTGDVCLLELGGTVVTSAPHIKSDTNGKGVAATLGTDNVSAIALEQGVSGEKIRVYITPTLIANS